MDASFGYAIWESLKLFFLLVVVVTLVISLSIGGCIGYSIGKKHHENLTPVITTNTVVQTNWVEKSNQKE